MTRRYFIWRLSDREPWRVYGTRKHMFPDERNTGMTAWAGDGYQKGLIECRRLNALRYYIKQAAVGKAQAQLPLDTEQKGAR